MRKMDLLVGAAILFAGCASTPPKVVLVPVVPEPKPDPPALIFPQTALELPDPQPIPPDAIPKREPPVQPAVTETVPVRTAPRRPSAAAPVKREPEVTEPTQAEAAKPSVRTPLIADDPKLPRLDMIQKRLDALNAMHARLLSKTGRDAETTRARIQFFIDEAEKALQRKDLRQADSLASRAEVLAEDLLGVR